MGIGWCQSTENLVRAWTMNVLVGRFVGTGAVRLGAASNLVRAWTMTVLLRRFVGAGARRD